jgi:hypothetical protein
VNDAHAVVALLGDEYCVAVGRERERDRRRKGGGRADAVRCAVGAAGERAHAVGGRAPRRGSRRGEKKEEKGTAAAAAVEEVHLPPRSHTALELSRCQRSR